MAHSSWAYPCPQPNASVFEIGCPLPCLERTDVNGLRSNWMTLSHVWLDLPGGRFQSDGGLRIVAATAGDIYKLLAYTVSKAIIASAFFFNTFTVFNTHQHMLITGGLKCDTGKCGMVKNAFSHIYQSCSLVPRFPVSRFQLSRF